MNDIVLGESSQGRMADALAHGGDEGRDKLRKAWGRRKYPLIPRSPNGTTQPPLVAITVNCTVRQTRGTETS